MEPSGAISVNIVMAPSYDAESPTALAVPVPCVAISVHVPLPARLQPLDEMLVPPTETFTRAAGVSCFATLIDVDSTCAGPWPSTQKLKFRVTVTV